MLIFAAGCGAAEHPKGGGTAMVTRRAWEALAALSVRQPECSGIGKEKTQFEKQYLRQQTNRPLNFCFGRLKDAPLYFM